MDSHSTSTKERDDDATTSDRDGDKDKGKDGNDHSSFSAEAHRSAVATFVKSLLKVADREGGIGEQVRVIARSQNDSASTSEKAVLKVENRGKLRTFFFGSDYKSLGELRKEMVKTQNDIAKLKELLSKATNDSDKAELSAQIKVLEDFQVKIDAFVQARENQFSLFGWLFKRSEK
jgi:hypothetical protein